MERSELMEAITVALEVDERAVLEAVCAYLMEKSTPTDPRLNVAYAIEFLLGTATRSADQAREGCELGWIGTERDPVVQRNQSAGY